MAATTTITSSYLRRLIGAAALDTGVYEEIEADGSATSQAFLTVVLSSLAAGIGAQNLGGDRVLAFVFVAIVWLIAWAAWALVTFEVGVHILPARTTQTSLGELLRTIGFASTPGFLNVFGVLRGGAAPAFTISAVWMLAAMVVAVRQSLDYDNTGRAVAVCALGWLMAIAVAVTLGLLFGPVVY